MALKFPPQKTKKLHKDFKRNVMLGVYVENTDARLNLALEDYLFNGLSASDEGYFLLWHNAPSIIVGRHQNTVQEINKDLVNRYSLPVVRRMTGGGAVYHDLGNLNFSFLRPLRDGEGSAIDFTIFLQPILQTLKALGVNAEFSSRNDLTCSERKISGSAQLRRGGQGVKRVLHHGTLLVNLDLDMLGAVLTGAPDKYLSKGVASIRSRVANLSEFLPNGIGMDELKASLMQNCANEIMKLDAKVINEARALALQKYATTAWNYGASPPFTEKRRERFAWGLVECNLDVKAGHIVGIKIFGDFFAENNVEELENLLLNVPYTAEGLQLALREVDFKKYFSGCDAVIMQEFFCKV